MPSFGERSRKNLETCHPLIQDLLNECIKYFDFSVIEGHRTTAEQQKVFAEGKSTLDGVNKKSRHQTLPSEAVDVMPWPPELHGKNIWDDMERWCQFIGKVQGIALMMGISIRVGLDWNNDGSIKDHKFVDAPHIELLYSE